MEENYHPEIDKTPLLDNDGAARYRSVIGSLNWIITLGRFDVAYATSALSRFSMQPREGHLAASLRILRYSKTFPKGRILVDKKIPDQSNYKDDQHLDWREFYPDAEEEMPTDLPQSSGKKARITVYVDADHAHDVVTRRSITGILVLVNNTPVK